MSLRKGEINAELIRKRKCVLERNARTERHQIGGNHHFEGFWTLWITQRVVPREAISTSTTKKAMEAKKKKKMIALTYERRHPLITTTPHATAVRGGTGKRNKKQNENMRSIAVTIGHKHFGMLHALIPTKFTLLMRRRRAMTTNSHSWVCSQMPSNVCQFTLNLFQSEEPTGGGKRKRLRSKL
uniref:Uncharacterized protein TCIL3000_11_1900 n=1 Tax=Trypanosoma congolense (strain IL3000) TaxID=1068625 RepID=G0UZI6_TRYCI|nr:unnamed protein product [Trypanosoma congolense IL3000]